MPLASTSIDATSSPAFTFSANSITYTILEGVAITADNNWDAIYGNNVSGEAINNMGTISGATAVYLTGGNNVIWNEASGAVSGVDGLSGIGDNDLVTNEGHIVASSAGLYFSGALIKVFNSGSIIAGSTGVSLAGATGYLNNSGLISSADDAVVTTSDGFLFRNTGAVEGKIEFKGAGDALRNLGRIAGDITFTSGANSFDGRGGTVDGKIVGGTGVDTFVAGSDGETMDGGSGRNSLTGGAGADMFIFSAMGAGNTTAIVGFKHGVDKIELEHAVFTALRAGKTAVFAIANKATSAADHLFYNSSNGNLYYDADGNGAGKATFLGNIGEGLALTASDFKVV